MNFENRRHGSRSPEVVVEYSRGARDWGRGILRARGRRERSDIALVVFPVNSCTERGGERNLERAQAKVQLSLDGEEKVIMALRKAPLGAG
jgi:hypothetical protein